MRFFGADIVLHLVNFIIGFIEAILGLRLILLLVGAGQSAPFVKWILATSDPLINPFRGMFPNPVLSGGYVIEINTLIALLAYAILGYLIAELVAFLQYHTLSYTYKDEDRPRHRR